MEEVLAIKVRLKPGNLQAQKINKQKNTCQL